MLRSAKRKDVSTQSLILTNDHGKADDGQDYVSDLEACRDCVEQLSLERMEDGDERPKRFQDGDAPSQVPQTGAQVVGVNAAEVQARLQGGGASADRAEGGDEVADLEQQVICRVHVPHVVIGRAERLVDDIGFVAEDVRQVNVGHDDGRGGLVAAFRTPAAQSLPAGPLQQAFTLMSNLRVQ